jgi:hypothetical protein
MSYNYSFLEIQERLELLELVLHFDTEKLPTFTNADRICINQECGSLMDFRAYLRGQIDHSEVRLYHVPENINEKIVKAQYYINKHNWKHESYRN